jgi:uncharacterized membrane protein
LATSTADAMHSLDRTTVAAALLGKSAGSRTFTPVAVLAARGRLGANPQIRGAIIVAAVGELIGDKLPSTPSRTQPLPLIGRIASGTFCGWVAGGDTGALVGAATGAAATFGFYQARKAESARMPALLAGLLEDAIAIGLANLAVALLSAE